MEQHQKLSAIILAGGQSSRMGTDKALIIIERQPLLRHIAQIAQQCVDHVYVITSWPQKYQQILPDGCKLIKENLQQGPLVAFSQALTLINTEWILLLACDLPNLKAEIIKQWVLNLSTTPPEAIAVLPKNPAGWEPLCGFYRRCCLDSLTQYQEKGGRSFQGWLSQQHIKEISLNNPDMLYNCNTPQELKKLLSQNN